MKTDEDQIRELVATWMSATKAGDLDTVLDLMTDDVVFLVAGQQPFGKREFAARMKPPVSGAPAPAIDGHSHIKELHVEGNLAYLVNQLDVDISPPHGPTTRHTGHVLTVLRKQGGRWQLARDANLLQPVRL
ncbi:MAG TPA: SgcJ/EcaC family oxidoreductase [Steroidobacteraceae bacterium]|nr:SgcJ/EcaC family oxidoreductase [Steroidobacteraceae bacterium]